MFVSTILLEQRNWEVLIKGCPRNGKIRVKYFTDRSKEVLFCGSFMLFLSCVCYVFLRVCLVLPCGHLLAKG